MKLVSLRICCPKGNLQAYSKIIYKLGSSIAGLDCHRRMSPFLPLQSPLTGKLGMACSSKLKFPYHFPQIWIPWRGANTEHGTMCMLCIMQAINIYIHTYIHTFHRKSLKLIGKITSKSETTWGLIQFCRMNRSANDYPRKTHQTPTVDG